MMKTLEEVGLDYSLFFPLSRKSLDILFFSIEQIVLLQSIIHPLTAQLVVTCSNFGINVGNMKSQKVTCSSWTSLPR